MEILSSNDLLHRYMYRKGMEIAYDHEIGSKNSSPQLPHPDGDHRAVSQGKVTCESSAICINTYESNRQGDVHRYNKVPLQSFEWYEHTNQEIKDFTGFPGRHMDSSTIIYVAPTDGWEKSNLKRV